jgi:hypothetical protein
MDYTQITGMEPQGAIYKSQRHGRPVFMIDATYTFEDGRTAKGSIYCDRKKDVPRTIEREQRAIAAGAMSGQIDADGTLGMTCTRYTIGTGGLVPSTSERT